MKTFEAHIAFSYRCSNLYLDIFSESRPKINIGDNQSFKEMRKLIIFKAIVSSVLGIFLSYFGGELL